MTCERLCNQQRQPCPSPYLCGTGCYFNEANDSGHKVAHGKRTDYFGEAAKELYIEMYDTPGNYWDRLPWYGRLGTVCGVVLAVGLVVGLS
ncbi:MAG: hypothetical protein V4858_17045 [Pseudomonadota bacterium]